MHYLIDGYNLLFRATQPKTGEPFEKTRKSLLEHLNAYASLLNISISIVFDAPKQNEFLNRGHFGALEIIFTAKGQSADDFLIEWLEEHAFVRDFTIVTSDRAVERKAKGLGTPVIGTKAFIDLLQKRRQKKVKVTPKQILSTKGKNETLPPLSDLASWEKIFLEQLKQNQM